MSQRRAKGRRQMEEEEEEEMDTQGPEAEQSQASGRLSQAQNAASKMDTQLQKRKVVEMVRYLLCADRKKAPVRRKDIIDKVLGEHSRAFPVLFDKANQQLRQVFGVEAKEILRGKGKYYVVVNTLPADKRDLLVEW